MSRGQCEIVRLPWVPGARMPGLSRALMRDSYLEFRCWLPSRCLQLPRVVATEKNNTLTQVTCPGERAPVLFMGQFLIPIDLLPFHC